MLARSEAAGGGRVAISARSVWLLAMLIIYVVVFASDTTTWISTLRNDENRIQQIAETAAWNSLENSYEVMAFLYARTSENQRLIVEFGSGLIFISYCMVRLRSHKALFLVSVWLISPMLFFLTQFNKDTILIYFVIASAFILASRLPVPIKLVGVSFIYVAYAAIFREYYYLILSVFILLWFLRRIPAVGMLIVVLVGLALLLLSPPHVYAQLEGSRDLVNADRLGRNLPGMRTAFDNLMAPTDAFKFIANYLYAAARLNFPFFASFAPRDAFMFLVVLSLGWISVKGLRGPDRVADSTCLFLAHVAVSICFEPDVGSYLRHTSSAIPYLIPAVMLFDRGTRSRLRARSTGSGSGPAPAYAAAARPARSPQQPPTSHPAPG